MKFYFLRTKTSLKYFFNYCFQNIRKIWRTTCLINGISVNKVNWLKNIKEKKLQTWPSLPSTCWNYRTATASLTHMLPRKFSRAPCSQIALWRNLLTTWCSKGQLGLLYMQCTGEHILFFKNYFQKLFFIGWTRDKVTKTINFNMEKTMVSLRVCAPVCWQIVNHLFVCADVRKM